MELLLTIVFIIVVLCIILEVIRKSVSDSRQAKIDDMLKPRTDEGVERLRAEKQEFDEKVESLRAKWQLHPLYHEIINVCKLEVMRFYTDIIQGKTEGYSRGFVNGKWGPEIRISPWGDGVVIYSKERVDIVFDKLGYQSVDIPQFLALTLTIGDGLIEEFKGNPNVQISASYYNSWEDGWKNEVLVGVSEDIINSRKGLKPVDLK